ncbi:plectin-like isoform X3 [Lampetra fluviatilis]
MGQIFVEERERNARLILQMCCMDERDRVQKKTFTKWINNHLQQVRVNIGDLYEDLRDGQALISLLESMSGDCIIREKGRLRVHHVQNIQIALNYLQHQQVKLVNIRKEDIVDGNPKLTLGLIWTIILHYQVSAGQVGGTPGRERLLAWARLVAKDVPGLSCHNFSSSWRDGRLLCAIVHAHRPGLVDLEEVRRRGARQNLEEALSLAESELGVPRLLDPEDVDVDAPDEKSIITYVSALHNALHKQGGQSRVALDVNEDADEFWRLAASLRVWIEERTITLQSRTFPYSIDKLMVMQKEHALMKNSEFPKKKAELLQLEEVYKSMEPQLSNDGHEACRPDELHEAWSGLLNASANYEDAIVTEVQRLEMLQRLAQKMEVDTNTCAEGLNKVYEALQADVALINSGRAPQHGEEISRCLSEIEVFVQSLYPDVRTLTDGGCSQPELLQTRLRRLEEQVASLRAEHAKITSRAGEGARKRSRDEAQLQEASSQQDQTAAAYLQELLTWVQSNQVTVDKSGYGKDLDETTALLEEQKALHQTIENFRSSLGEAQQTMQSVSQGSRYDYSKSLDKLEQQYSKLLNGSRARLGLLENQQGFLRRCQREMLWLTQREEREVAYDWSDLNPDLEPKKEAYALLVRELEQREPAFREVVQAGEDLVGEGHPGNPTIQAYLLALKTQWSWLLQLCSCVETHLVENDVYFQFFKDARELEQQLRRVQDAVRRRYACDVSTPLARLENLLQDAQEEKEQLSELKVGASKLHKRAKGVVQLKPRRPEFSPRSPTPITALCNYHQDQVTLTKHDECSLSGAEDGRWTVSSPSGRSGTVPSVCFLVPAPNKEALDSAARVEQRYQDSVSLWKQLYGKMQGLLLWQHLHADMGIVMAWNIDNFRGLAEQDYLSVMDALESHYGQLEGHNEASQAFSAAEMQQLRGDVATCRTRYQQLLEQLVLEERTDEDSEQLLSDLAALSQRLRECQEQLTHGVRAPLDAETAQYVQLCLTAQEGLHREVESLGSEVDRMARKCEPVLNQGVASPRLHALRSQLEQLQHSLQQTHSLSLLYREKLSMLNEVKSSMEETERLLGSYEGRLSEESGIPNETDGIDAYRNTVRQWQTEVSQKRRSMRGLEEALGRALTVGERLSRTHGEACVDLARMRDATQALQGRWDSVDAQVDSRVRDLEKLSRILGHYRQSYQTIMQWVQEVGGQQEEPLPTQTADYQELSSQLNQHKELVTEIDRRQDKVNECQRYSEQYCAALKEYEMQLMEYRALVESAHSGPSRHQWQQSEADTIAQEFLDLRGRYTALVNLTGHRVKTISDSLQQLQQQEETTGKCTGIGGEFVSSDRGEDWGGEETADTCAGSPAPQVFSDESPSSTQNALPEQDATDSAICLNEDSDDAEIAREAEEDPARDATFSLGSPLDGSEALHAECDSHRSASEMCADGDDDKDDEDETQGCELESPSVFSREHVDLATMLDQQLEDDEPEDASKAREGDPNSQEQQFLDSWKAMHAWLLEISDALSQEPGCDDGIDTLTERLLKLKELQGGLRAHEEAYEECVDLGELAVEAAALTSNHGQFQSMLGELRATWEKVQALSAEREQSLEASLMLSGQLVDALQALSAWLDGVEPLLSPDFPVLGDMDTVARLLREHQALREELSEHGQSAEFVRRASRECAVLGGGNSCGMVERSEALLARWEAVCRLATAKETRLHGALQQQAEELARAMTRQLEWCTLADRMLYPHDALPEEEDGLQELAKQHAEWMLELESREEEMARISGLADAILSTCHPDGTNSLKQCLASVHNNFQEVSGRAWRLQAWLDTSLRELEEQAHLAEEMFLWLQEAQDSLAEKETELLPQDEESIQGLIDEHQSLMERMMLKQPEMDRLGRCNRRKFSSESQLSGTLSPFLDKTRTRKLSGSQPDSPVSSPLSPGPLSEPRDPHVTALVACWHQVWLAALERQGRLRDALQQSQTMRQEMEQEKFSFAQWRKLFSQQTKLKKSRLMDIFKRLDGDQDGRITRDEFAREISLLGLGSEEWELDAVVGRFGVQEGTLVDYYQFVSELCPSKAGGSMTDADKIDDEVIRKVSACKCSRRFQVEQVEENKYRFGDSQQLRLVRILRSTVMVRVGGGWLSLDDFLQKNDPCRAKGRTNVDLRERLSSGEGGGKAMVLFRSKSGGGKVAAPSRHNSTSSLPSLSACPEDAAPAGGSRDSQQASDAAANKFRKSGNGKSGRKERIGQLSSSVSSIPSQALSSGSHKPSGIPPATTAEARPGNNSSSSRVSPTQRRSGTAPAPLARMATKVEPSTAPAADGPNQKASRPLPAKVSKIPTHASHATSRTATSNGPKH